jgi:hypothetical protein
MMMVQDISTRSKMFNKSVLSITIFHFKIKNRITRNRKIMTGTLLLVSTLAIPMHFTVAAETHRKNIPPEATAVIHAVHESARQIDIPALRRLMTYDFVWSFGDNNPHRDTALKSWNKNRSDFERLARVSSLPCSRIENTIEFPSNAGINYRAGFKKVGND